MFDKLLIANRGEIACRIAATAARLGIASVAVFSEADRHAKHVLACDEAVGVGPPAARESYLQGGRIIAAALESGAQAIHPGYGFLSENAAFARACQDAGLIFIGPPAAAIEAMGSKSAAKSLMEEAGVPLVPGYHGHDQDPVVLAAAADAIGYPVLIKASAGGGGKGMRIVTAPADFGAALHSCKREARAAFGDDAVLVEKYLLRPRHIEIQVFADRHGRCIYLFERDCSVQRRHQKVLEEAPAPGMTRARREAMGAAAVAAAQAVGYVGAGTVEFIVNQDESFYFMEMNTRLQVEHPVTEMITGFDLVEWQFRIAAGEALPARQDELVMHGHSLEARLYAENPERGFLPATGCLERLRFPEAVEFAVARVPAAGASRAALRIDSGIREGDSITPFYDPMIAKLIVWGKDRPEALSRMVTALGKTQIVGLHTNLAFLSRLVDCAAFRSADLDTGLIERHHAALFPAPAPVDWNSVALAAAVVLATERRDEGADPWSRRAGWRLNGRATRELRFAHGDDMCVAALRYGAQGCTLTLGGQSGSFTLGAVTQGSIEIRLGEGALEAEFEWQGTLLHLFGRDSQIVLDWLDAHPPDFEAFVEEGRLTAPMPGKVVAIMTEPGAAVERGAPLLVMEAMKMEHTITAPRAGVVAEIRFAVGEQVAEGAELLVFAAEPGTP